MQDVYVPPTAGQQTSSDLTAQPPLLTSTPQTAGQDFSLDDTTQPPSLTSTVAESCDSK